MREIKFKAWWIALDSMCEVLTIENDFNTKTPKDVFVFNKNPFTENTTFPLTIDEIELLQYTGLNDCYGEEIYENDILFDEHTEEYCEVVFDKGSFKAVFATCCTELEEAADVARIVGNRYANPDLLDNLKR